MNSIKEIILLELLYKQSSVNKERLLEMFMNVVDGTDIYKRLEETLNTNIFIGAEATELHERSNLLLNEVRVKPQEAINIFFKLEELVLNLEKKKDDSQKLLKGLDFFESRPGVVSKVDAATYTKYYDAFNKALIYLTVTLYGVEGITDWSVFPMGSFADLIAFVDTVLSNKICENNIIRKKWSVIDKYYTGGRSGISYNGCELAYEEDTDIKKIGTDKSPYIRTGICGDKKLVEGFGYITGVSVSDVNALFEGELINDININNIVIDPTSIDFSSVYVPVEFLSKVLGTRKFIIPPNTYVKLLNKYFLNKTILERKGNSRCLLCDRMIESGESGICANHFDYTQNQ